MCTQNLLIYKKISVLKEYIFSLRIYFVLFQLKTIETLLGNTTKIGDVIVLGMITQLKEVS